MSILEKFPQIIKGLESVRAARDPWSVTFGELWSVHLDPLDECDAKKLPGHFRGSKSCSRAGAALTDVRPMHAMHMQRPMHRRAACKSRFITFDQPNRKQK